MPCTRRGEKFGSWAGTGEPFERGGRPRKGLVFQAESARNSNWPGITGRKRQGPGATTKSGLYSNACQGTAVQGIPTKNNKLCVEARGGGGDRDLIRRHDRTEEGKGKSLVSATKKTQTPCRTWEEGDQQDRDCSAFGAAKERVEEHKGDRRRPPVKRKETKKPGPNAWVMVTIKDEERMQNKKGLFLRKCPGTENKGSSGGRRGKNQGHSSTELFAFFGERRRLDVVNDGGEMVLKKIREGMVPREGGAAQGRGARLRSGAGCHKGESGHSAGENGKCAQKEQRDANYKSVVGKRIKLPRREEAKSR